MDIKLNWLEIKKHFNESFRTNFHVSIASVDKENSPRSFSMQRNPQILSDGRKMAFFNNVSTQTHCSLVCFLLGLVFLGCGRDYSQTNKKALNVFQVHTIAISVSNLDSSMKWYRENLGFTLLKRRDFPESGLLTALIGNVGFQLELIQKDGSVPIAQYLKDPSQPTLFHGFKKIVLKTKEVDSLYSFLRSKDVQFVYPEVRVTKGVWGRWFMIEDVDGNIIQIIDGLL